MSPHPGTVIRNQLLASLPGKERERVLAGCESVELVSAQVLAVPGGPVAQVYFPTSSVLSLATRLYARTSLGVGLIGSEGMLGASLALGVVEAPLHSQVQNPGKALCMAGLPFRQALLQCPVLQQRLQHYLYVVMCQLAQAANCVHFHVLEARLARWLLMTQDRTHRNEFHLTHELLASTLGVRRVGVTKAATALHQRKLISYSRGDITVLDRSGLELAACGCYEADRISYTGMLN